MVISLQWQTYLLMNCPISYITTKLANELCIKPYRSKNVRINALGGAISNNTYAVGSVNIVTGEGAITVDSFI